MNTSPVRNLKYTNKKVQLALKNRTYFDGTVIKVTSDYIFLKNEKFSFIEISHSDVVAICVYQDQDVPFNTNDKENEKDYNSEYNF